MVPKPNVTDRISVDTSFDNESSCKRYQGLVEDELKNDAQLFKVNFRENFIGFFLIKNEEMYSISNLAGIFKEYQKLGFGICLNYFIIKESQINNRGVLKTAFSSNNTGASNIHKTLGFDVYKTLTIFTKNNKFNNEWEFK